MSEIRHIVFDIGKVLVHYDPDLPFSRLYPRRGRAALVLRQCLHPRLEHRAGSRPHLGGCRELLIDAHPKHAENIRGFRRHGRVVRTPMRQRRGDDWADRFGCDVTLLTNLAADTFREARERFAFLDQPAASRSLAMSA